MIHTIKPGLLAVVLGTALAGAALCTQAQAASEDTAAVRNALERTMPGTAVTAVRTSPVAGLYEVTAGKNLFYTDSQARYLLMGNIYDITTHKDLTAARLEELGYTPAPTADANIAWEDLPATGAIVENKGARRKVAIIADINCPYCRKLNTILQGMEDVEVHTYLVALWERSEAVTQTVLCALDRGAALQRAFSDDLPPEFADDCDPSLLEANSAFSERHGINGTPVMIREDGMRVTGLRSQAFIESWLQ